MPYDGETPPYAHLAEPPEELNELAHAVIGAAIEVHRHMGPGLPEESYMGALAIEFEARGIPFERQKRVDIHYKGVRVGCGKIDFLVAGRLVVEVKSCEAILPVHRLQTRSYMRIIREMLGLLINFNVPVLKDGIKRIVDTVDPDAPPPAHRARGG